jgi:hypothetical protein
MNRDENVRLADHNMPEISHTLTSKSAPRAESSSFWPATAERVPAKSDGTVRAPPGGLGRREGAQMSLPSGTQGWSTKYCEFLQQPAGSNGLSRLPSLIISAVILGAEAKSSLVTGTRTSGCSDRDCDASGSEGPQSDAYAGIPVGWRTG